MNKKFFTFLIFCILSIFSFNNQKAYAWREVDPCIGNIAAQCSYYINNLKIGTLPLDTTKTVTAGDSDKLSGEIDSNQTININWVLTSKPQGSPSSAPADYFYIVNYKCDNALSNVDTNIYNYSFIGTYPSNKSSSQNITFRIPEKAENIPGCSDASGTCYCRIAWQLFDKNKALEGGSISQPFAIKNNVVNNVKIYYPTPTQKSGINYEEGAAILRVKKTDLDLTKATTKQVNDFVAKRNLKLVKRINSYNLLYVKSISKSVYRSITLSMAKDSQLEYIQPNNYYTINFSPNDQAYKSQYSLNNNGNPDKISGAKKDADMDVAEAWDKYNPTKDIVVAVLDSGFKTDSSDINYWDGGTCWAPDGTGKCPNHGWDAFDDDNDPSQGHFHGVFTSSIIGSKTNNSLGMAGFSTKDKIKVMLVKLSQDAPTPYLSDSSIVAGVEFALKNKANIINASFGGAGQSPAMETAFKSFMDAGGLVIAAAGNTNRMHDSSYFISPCDIKHEALLCIASSDQADKKSDFSDYGKDSVHISAPGSLIVGMKHDGKYYLENGTSFAAPNTAGVAAMIWSQKTSLSNKELAKLIMDTGDPLSDFAGKTVTGKRVNAYRALTGENPPDDGGDDDNNPPQPPPDEGDFKIIYPNGGEKFKTGDEVEIKWSIGKDKNAKVMLTLIDYQSGEPKHVVLTFDESNDGSYKFKITDSILQTISGSSKKGDKYKIGGVLYSFKSTNKILLKQYIDYLAKITSKGVKSTSASDLSDNYFSINMGDDQNPPPDDDDDNPPPPPEEDYIKVIYPNGGERFKTGDKIKVEWEAKIPNYTDPYIPFFIQVCDWNKNRPYPWNCSNVIDNSEPSADGYADNDERSYEIILKDNLIRNFSNNNNNKGDKYKIRVGLVIPSHKKEIEDLSDDYFSINMDEDDDDSLKLIYPNGGEKFKTGDEVEVKWKGGKPSDKVDEIAIIDDQGLPYRKVKVPISSNDGINDGSFKFKITDKLLEDLDSPLRKGNKYKVSIAVKISSNKLIEDLSDDYFSINMGDDQNPPPDDDDDNPPQPPPQIEKPLVVTESIGVSNSKLTFKATVWVGKTPADVEYWFESYQRDDQGNPVVGSQEKTPIPNGQMRTGPGMNHLFTGYRNNYIAGKVYCFTPYAKFKGANDIDAGFGAELCYPDVPWVITLPATNWQGNKATINGAITYFAKNPKLQTYFKYYIEGNEKNAKEVTGKIFSKPTSGPERTSFNEQFIIPDVLQKYCYRACARVPNNPKIFGCGIEWCFPIQSTDLLIENISVETYAEGEGSNTRFGGQIKSFDQNIWGLPTSRIVPGFLVYPKGSWDPNGDKNIDIKWIGPQNQSDFTVDTSKQIAKFHIVVNGMDFQGSNYCFKAYAIDKKTSKTFYAQEELCGHAGGDNNDDDTDNGDDNNDQNPPPDDDNDDGDNKTSCSIVQLSAAWCYPCQQLKPILSNVAKKYNTILDESANNQTKYDSDVIGNKTGKTKFFYVDIDKFRPKDWSSLIAKYGLGNFVPQIAVYKNGKDVALSRGIFDENQIINDLVKKYCGDDGGSENSENNNGNNDSPETKKPWTLMVYMTADNNLNNFGKEDIDEMKRIGSNKDANILVMYDGRQQNDSAYYYIERENAKIEKNLGEVNTGDPKVLIDFMNYSIKNYPADNYGLVLWNHGSGVIGTDSVRRTNETGKTIIFDVGFDDGSNNDALNNSELDSALSQIKTENKIDKFGLVFFDACLMQMVEIADYLKDDFMYMAGSEDVAPGTGLNYSIALSKLSASTKPKDFGVSLVETANLSGYTTVSLIDLSKIQEVVNQIALFSKQLISSGGYDSQPIQRSINGAIEFGTMYHDLGSFIENISTSGISIASAQGLKNAIKSAIILVKNSSQYANSQGLSILLRPFINNQYKGLNFSSVTCWDEFLSKTTCGQ